MDSKTIAIIAALLLLQAVATVLSKPKQKSLTAQKAKQLLPSKPSSKLGSPFRQLF